LASNPTSIAKTTFVTALLPDVACIFFLPTLIFYTTENCQKTHSLHLLSITTKDTNMTKEIPLSRKLAAEFIAMTLFVWIGCGTAVSSQVRQCQG
jgi:hypothetical protein